MNYKEFESPHEWDRFCSYISEINRYVLDEHWKKFFNVILFTAKKREINLKNGTSLCLWPCELGEWEYNSFMTEISFTA